jgi:hypothetical protein
MTTKTAADLQKWDVINFRRSNERNFKAGLVWSVDTESFAGIQSTFVTVEVNNKKQLLRITDSVEWSFMGSMVAE